MPRKNKSSAPAAPQPLSGPQRLNKVLAAAGLGSRRDCEQLILDGRIEIDGEAVTDLATKVDPSTAKITFDGSQLRAFRPVYYALHKPTGVLSTNRDPSGRMRAIDLLNVKERIFSVGRLDRFSEGLMLLTNDGELAQRLAHPRFGVQKLYLATVQGEITKVDLEKLIRGVRLSEGYAKVDAVKVRKQRAGSAELEIALSEGKNREIRRILARLGHKVVALRRLAIGPLRLGQLPVGGWRPLTRDEVLALYRTTSERPKRRKSTRPRTSVKPEDASDIADVNENELEDEALQIGDFQSSFEDEEDDEFESMIFDGTSFDDSDDEPLELNSESIRGTVIAYDDEEGADEAPEMTRRSKRPPRGRDRAESSSDARSSRKRSPNDLRNRNARPGGKPAGASRGGPSARPKTGRPTSGDAPAPRTGSRTSGAGRTGTGRTGTGRPISGSRPTGSRSAGARTTGSRTAGPRGTGSRAGGTSRPGSKPGGPRTSRPSAGSGPRTGTGKPGGGRPGSGRTGGPGANGPGASGPRSSGPGSSGPRGNGPRTGGPRTGGRPGGRPGGGRPSGGRPSGGRPGRRTAWR